jgi:hypothetical protein
MRDATKRKGRGERLHNSKVAAVEETAVVEEETMAVAVEETAVDAVAAAGLLTVKTFSKFESRNSTKSFKRREERP